MKLYLYPSLISPFWVNLITCSIVSGPVSGSYRKGHNYTLSIWKSVMAPNKKIADACRAMEMYGIPKVKTKAVLRELLKLYDSSWELVVQEGYKVLLEVLLDRQQEEEVCFYLIFMLHLLLMLTVMLSIISVYHVMEEKYEKIYSFCHFFCAINMVLYH